MPSSYTDDDLADGRAALLSGWSSGSEPGLIITRASGALVWDSKGNEYIDCTSMAWSNNIGASAPEVVEAAFAQARQLSHLRSNFDSIPLLLLSKAMTKSAPGDLKRIGFTLHGSLAVEMAMKLAMLNRPQHTGPWLALADGYHGRSLASMGLGWPHPNHAFDRIFPEVLRVPQPYAYRSGRTADGEVDYCISELRDTISRRATGLPPALFMEPVQGNGTQLDFPRRYYQEVRQVCTEHGIAPLLGQPKNPLVYIFQSHFGAVAADVLQVVVFLAIFSCVLANMVVATRLTFALSRDKMLPASGLLGRVNATTRTPIGSILLVAAVGIGINLLSAGIAANVVSICSVAYYFIYALTVGGAIYAWRKARMPGHRAGDFSLGRWFIPVAVLAFSYAAVVIVIALAPHEGHTAAMYLFGAEVVGVLWYVLYLRRQITNRSAGVLRQEVVELEESAQPVGGPAGHNVTR